VSFIGKKADRVNRDCQLSGIGCTVKVSQNFFNDTIAVADHQIGQIAFELTFLGLEPLQMFSCREPISQLIREVLPLLCDQGFPVNELCDFEHIADSLEPSQVVM